MGRHFVAPFAAVIVAVASHGCGSSPTSPSFSPGTPSPPATPSVSATALRIEGNASLSSIGQTSQLTAIATLTDGTTKDVTSDAQWQSTEPSVVGVSSTGMVTVAGFGVGTIRSQYQGRSAQLELIATPPGTFVAFGRVREPGQGGVDGVRVLDTQSGNSTFTRTIGGFEAGRYSIHGLTDARLAFEKDGYETRQVEVQRNVYTDVPIQRIVRLTGGETVTPADLAPNDMSYVVGADRCEPCRLIRIVNLSAGTLHLIVKWSEARAALNLWVGGQRFSGMYPELAADVPVAAGEITVYVGAVTRSQAYYIPFTLATGMK